MLQGCVVREIHTMFSGFLGIPVRVSESIETNGCRKSRATEKECRESRAAVKSSW